MINKNMKISERKIILSVATIFLSLILLTQMGFCLTIQEFLKDMKSHPNDYYLLINRSQEEVDYLLQNTSLQNLKNYFNIQVSSGFIPNKHFVLLEIPSTPFGEEYSVYREKSYVELFSGLTLLPPGVNDLNYYLDNEFFSYNYLVIFATTQEFYSVLDPRFLDKNQEEFKLLDSNGDKTISELELVNYYLKKFTDRLINYSRSPINTDYIVISENNLGEAVLGSRDFCPGFYNDTIFNKKNFSYYKDEEGQFFRNLTLVEDLCKNTFAVDEAVCVNDSIQYQRILCPADFSCSNGACVSKDERRTLFTLIIRWIYGDVDLVDIISEIYSWLLN